MEETNRQALTRLTRAESTSVTIGAIGAQILTIGGLGAAVGLLIAGFPAYSVAAIIPAVLGGAAQIAAALNRKDK